jgi:hypothetical protein
MALRPDIILTMNTNELIEALDAEIARLEEARAILEDDRIPNGRTTAVKRTMSPEGRARIAAAQTARWAKAKRAK